MNVELMFRTLPGDTNNKNILPERDPSPTVYPHKSNRWVYNRVICPGVMQLLWRKLRGGMMLS